MRRLRAARAVFRRADSDAFWRRYRRPHAFPVVPRWAATAATRGREIKAQVERDESRNDKWCTMTSEAHFPKADRECRYCGAPLKFAKTPAGKTIPLDLRAPVYDLVGNELATRASLAFVTHFATCPHVKEASNSVKRTEPGEEK